MTKLPMAALLGDLHPPVARQSPDDVSDFHGELPTTLGQALWNISRRRAVVKLTAACQTGSRTVGSAAESVYTEAERNA
jgi:hypothetical protein